LTEALDFAWHGSASFTVRLGDANFLVDPSFSRAEEYGDWYVPNRNAPSWEQFLSMFVPHYVLISHGHFDHFDLHTVRRLIQHTDAVFAGSLDVNQVLEREFGLPASRRVVLAPDRPLSVGPVTVRAHPGVHWLTGEEGRRAARKLAGRPDRYGVMPCGGPVYGFLWEAEELLVYATGDTRPEGVSRASPFVAVLNVAAAIPHPVTKKLQTPILTPEEAVQLLRERLDAQLVIPIHHDFASHWNPVDLGPLEKWADESGRRLLLPRPNVWYRLTKAQSRGDR